MTTTLQQLCDDIDTGYIQGRSSIHGDQLDLLIELGEYTGEIRLMIAERNAALFDPWVKIRPWLFAVWVTGTIITVILATFFLTSPCAK